LATRVYLFAEENDFALEAWEGAPEEYRRIAADHRIGVRPGRNRHHVGIEIACENVGLTLRFGLGDLRQERSPMLVSLEASVQEDYESEDYDYGDGIPPFGVIEVYGAELARRESATEAEANAFLDLAGRFLLKHFLMFVFLDKEAGSVSSYWRGQVGLMGKMFVHDGQSGYRLKAFST